MYIYIHIPFCHNICSYCDFAKIYYNEKYINKYLDALKKEIQLKYKNEIVKTIYIGGGTPTSLNIDDLEKLLKITEVFNKDKKIEFTIESNVELSLDKIKLLKKYNVNRISLGVQSFNNKILKILNRTHNENDIIKCINLLKENDFNNINIDLIYAVTNDINIVKEDIKKALNLNINHISCYSLIIENNTMLKINNYQNIDEDIEYEIYKYIENMLEKNNFIHYEISNYSKAGFESIHNKNYWLNNSYYAFGLGAVSYLNNIRITNTRNINKYINNDYETSRIKENKKMQMENEIMLGLRMLKGINLNTFYLKYNKKLEDVFKIDDLLKDKILIKENNHIKVDKKYIYLLNEILIRLIN